MRYGIFMTKDLARLNLKFEGSAVDDHTMDINDLAPSLMEWANALSIVSEEVAPNNPPARLVITPDAAEEGSFLLELSVELPGIIEQTLKIFTSKEAKTAYTGIGASIIATTLIESVKKVYQQTPAAKAKHEQKIDKVADDISDKISTNPRFVSSVQEANAPLKKEGFKEISLSVPVGVKATVTIGTTDYQAVEEQLEDRIEIGQSRRELRVVIENLNFKEGKKWSLNDGDRTFTAAMRDDEFQKEIDSKEIAFFKNDSLDIELVTKQYQYKSGTLRSEHFIAKVIEHLPSGRLKPSIQQGSLFDD